MIPKMILEMAKACILVVLLTISSGCGVGTGLVLNEALHQDQATTPPILIEQHEFGAKTVKVYARVLFGRDLLIFSACEGEKALKKITIGKAEELKQYYKMTDDQKKQFIQDHLLASASAELPPQTGAKTSIPSSFGGLTKGFIK